MNRTVVVAIVAALALTSCAHHMRGSTAPDPHRPAVFVVAGYIVVNQEPIVIEKGDTSDIVWSLPKGSTFSFPNNGITISESGDEFRCNRDEDRQRFVCANRHSKPGHYKYTIRVLDGEKALEPLDPFIYNL